MESERRVEVKVRVKREGVYRSRGKSGEDGGRKRTGREGIKNDAL